MASSKAPTPFLPGTTQLVTTDTLAGVEKLCLDAPPGTLIFLDVDDTLSYMKANFFAVTPGTPSSPGSEYLDSLKKNRATDPLFSKKIAAFRLKRKVALVHEGWPDLIAKWIKKGCKSAHTVITI